MKIMSRLLLTMLALACVAVSLRAEEPRMPDTARIMKLLWEVPEFQPYMVPGTDSVVTDDQIMSMASEIFITRDHMDYGMFYGEVGAIDKVEEYCLAVLLGGKKSKPKVQKAIDEEFPPNAEGYHRMAALWYLVYSCNPNYNETAKDAVQMVIKQGRKRGISITEESARQYYEKAVRNSLAAAFRTELSRAGIKPDDRSLEMFIKPWYTYFISPTPENYMVITAGKNCVDDISNKKAGMKELAAAYDRAVLAFAGETFHTHWTYTSVRSSFYEEDIERVYAEYFRDIPMLGK